MQAAIDPAHARQKQELWSLLAAPSGIKTDPLLQLYLQPATDWYILPRSWFGQL